MSDRIYVLGSVTWGTDDHVKYIRNLGAYLDEAVARAECDKLNDLAKPRPGEYEHHNEAAEARLRPHDPGVEIQWDGIKYYVSEVPLRGGRDAP